MLRFINEKQRELIKRRRGRFPFSDGGRQLLEKVPGQEGR